MSAFTFSGSASMAVSRGTIPSSSKSKTITITADNDSTVRFRDDQVSVTEVFLRQCKLTLGFDPTSCPALQNTRIAHPTEKLQHMKRSYLHTTQEKASEMISRTIPRAVMALDSDKAESSAKIATFDHMFAVKKKYAHVPPLRGTTWSKDAAVILRELQALLPGEVNPYEAQIGGGGSSNNNNNYNKYSGLRALMKRFSELTFVECGITTLDAGILKFENLQDMNVSQNKAITKINFSVFPSSCFRSLIAQGNGIRRLHLLSHDDDDENENDYDRYPGASSAANNVVVLQNFLHLALAQNQLGPCLPPQFPQSFPRLHVLDIANNNLCSLGDILRITTALPELTHLVFYGNPAALTCNYVTLLIDALPKLESLDDRPINDDIRNVYSAAASQLRKAEAVTGKRRRRRTTTTTTSNRNTPVMTTSMAESDVTGIAEDTEAEIDGNESNEEEDGLEVVFEVGVEGVSGLPTPGSIFQRYGVGESELGGFQLPLSFTLTPPTYSIRIILPHGFDVSTAPVVFGGTSTSSNSSNSSSTGSTTAPAATAAAAAKPPTASRRGSTLTTDAAAAAAAATTTTTGTPLLQPDSVYASLEWKSGQETKIPSSGITVPLRDTLRFGSARIELLEHHHQQQQSSSSSSTTTSTLSSTADGSGSGSSSPHNNNNNNNNGVRIAAGLVSLAVLLNASDKSTLEAVMEIPLTCLTLPSACRHALTTVGKTANSAVSGGTGGGIAGAGADAAKSSLPPPAEEGGGSGGRRNSVVKPGIASSSTTTSAIPSSSSSTAVSPLLRALAPWNDEKQLQIEKEICSKVTSSGSIVFSGIVTLFLQKIPEIAAKPAPTTAAAAVPDATASGRPPTTGSSTKPK